MGKVKKKEKNTQVCGLYQIFPFINMFYLHILMEFVRASCDDPLSVICISLSLLFVVYLHYVGDLRMPAVLEGAVLEEAAS